VPPQLSENYGDFLAWNHHLVDAGIWESANTATNDTTRLNYFVSGLSAVYMAYPDIEEVIDAGRQLEEYTDWEYMICGPLAKEDGTVTGFTKREKTFSGLVVPWHSQNAQLLMDFIDWMYSSQENYDLCKYGRKGIVEIPRRQGSGVFGEAALFGYVLSFGQRKCFRPCGRVLFRKGVDLLYPLHVFRQRQGIPIL
jgi:hypothetical protein